MSRALIAVAVASWLCAAPTVASANEEGAAAGVITGAVAGAAVGGPIGAAIGAVVGGVTGGAATGAGVDEPEKVGEIAEPRGIANVKPALAAEPETTGSVVETTCVRSPQGTPMCRREVVR
jgi:phage tail tape-measure protein